MVMLLYNTSYPPCTRFFVKLHQNVWISQFLCHDYEVFAEFGQWLEILIYMHNTCRFTTATIYITIYIQLMGFTFTQRPRLRCQSPGKISWDGFPTLQPDCCLQTENKKTNKSFLLVLLLLVPFAPQWSIWVVIIRRSCNPILIWLSLYSSVDPLVPIHYLLMPLTSVPSWVVLLF